MLDTIAASHEKLIDLAQRLRSRSAIVEASAGLTLRQFQSGSILQGYVDAESRTGRGISFIVEMAWCPGWNIECSVRESSDDGQVVLHEFPVLQPQATAAVVAFLSTAVDELTAFANCMAIDDEHAERLEQTPV